MYWPGYAGAAEVQPPRDAVHPDVPAPGQHLRPGRHGGGAAAGRGAVGQVRRPHQLRRRQGQDSAGEVLT